MSDKNLLPQFNIDRNIAFNIKELRRAEDRQTEQIIKCLLIYFNLSYQEDLFGYRTLDPHHFAKTMNLSVENLFRTHPRPEYLKDRRFNKDFLHLWDSYLTNALFILHTQPIFQEYRGKDSNGDNLFISTNFLIIKEVQLFTRKVNNKDKFLYKYKLDPTFETNLQLYFIQANIKLFIDCKKKGIEDFYLHITSIYNSYRHQKDVFYFKFNELCDFFYISEDLQPKHKKSKLNKYFRTTESILQKIIPGLKFDWIKTSGRWKYTPIMSWTKLEPEDYAFDSKNIFINTFYKSIRRNLYDAYISQYDGLPDDESFLHWIKAPQTDYLKEVTIIACYHKFIRINPMYSSNIKEFASVFLKDLKKATNLEEFNQICLEEIQVRFSKLNFK